MLNSYEEKAYREMQDWKQRMLKAPSVSSKLTKGIQTKMNALIPEKIHQVITVTIEKMVKAVLFGSQYTSSTIKKGRSLQLQEAYVKRVGRHYKNAATIEGAVTGAGGILMGLADFPAFLAIKIKLLFEIASIYGFNVKDYKERLFILYVFKITFCSQQKRKEILSRMENWTTFIQTLPSDVDHFDWRDFQQEYRDYLDLAKLAQLIPIIGAVVGAVANNKLTEQLMTVAMNSYRLSYFKQIDRLEAGT
ncbi:MULTISPECIES: EcsC family protein [Olivibacter]|uniref:EcsC family protein n=1 Tax=Olivibacter jilunii TaxID=985016 RepID=A0ABW6AUQ6_9SPHI|nr:EcsC family protein [Pseudosphingobacterium sp.]